MPFPAKAVANEFLKLAKQEGKPVTPMQLIKLVYFAHGWHLALTGKPLLDERVEAWKYGPVVPSLYHEFKRYGNEEITDFARKDEIINKNGRITIGLSPVKLEGEGAEYAVHLVKKIWEVYGKYSAIQLSNLTHLPDTPWAKTSEKEIKGTDISNEEIKAYFESIAGRK